MNGTYTLLILKKSSIFMAQLLRSWWPNSVNNHGPGQGADELLNLCKGIVEKTVQHLATKGASEEYYLMNGHQCDFLIRRFEETLAHIKQSSSLDEKTIPVLQQLHQALLDAERLIHFSCVTCSEWLRAALEQVDMKETFSQLLYDVQWYTSVLQSILVDNFTDSSTTSFEPALCDGILSSGDKLGLLTAMTEDEKVLKKRLGSVKLDDLIEEELANQLLSSTSSSNLLFLNPEFLNEYYCGTLLGRGSFAKVRLTNLLGGEYAIKIFEKQKAYSFVQEVAALKDLGHHPRIVHLLCYSKNDSKCFLIMEKMDMELSTFLQRRRGNDKLSDLETVVLMLEIAEGIRYIHSKRMAHRDLKPGNILVNLEDPSNKSSRACSVKIVDFGLTKIKNVSKTYGNQTWNTGTPRYMAPEVIRAQDDLEKGAELNPRKADVYSFAIMCSEILTGENPFGDLPRNEMKKLVKAGEGHLRLNLPSECPERLASLIRRCWDGNFCNRPDFNEICRELRYIKALLLRGDQQKPKTRGDTVDQF